LFIDRNEENNRTLQQLFDNRDLPFFNRVIGGTFAPGSVFKPLVALAALEEGSVESDYTYDDQGYIKVNDLNIKTGILLNTEKLKGL